MGCGPSRGDVQEPGASTVFPGRQTLTHSCWEGRRQPASTPSSGDPAAGCGPGAADWVRSRECGLEPPPLLCPPRGESIPALPGLKLPTGLLQDEGGVHSPDLIADARAGLRLPGAPGAQEGAGWWHGGLGQERPDRPVGPAGARHSREAGPDLQ